MKMQFKPFALLSFAMVFVLFCACFFFTEGNTIHRMNDDETKTREPKPKGEMAEPLPSVGPVRENAENGADDQWDERRELKSARIGCLFVFLVATGLYLAWILSKIAGNPGCLPPVDFPGPLW